MWDISSVVMSVVAAVVGILGVFLAGHAVDLGFGIFGGGLVVFALIYLLTTVGRVYGRSARH